MPFGLIPNMFKNIVQLAQLPDSSTFDMLWNDESIEEVTKKAATQSLEEDEFYAWDDMPDEEEQFIGELDDPNIVDKAKYQVENPNAILTPWGPALSPETIGGVLDEYPGLESVIGLSIQEIDMMIQSADADEGDYGEILDIASEVGMEGNLDPNDVAVAMVENLDQQAEQEAKQGFFDQFPGEALGKALGEAQDVLKDIGLIGTAEAADSIDYSETGYPPGVAGSTAEMDYMTEDEPGLWGTVVDAFGDLFDKLADAPMTGRPQWRMDERLAMLNYILIPAPEDKYDASSEEVLVDIQDGLDAWKVDSDKGYSPEAIGLWLDSHPEWGNSAHGRNDLYQGVMDIFKREADAVDAVDDVEAVEAGATGEPFPLGKEDGDGKTPTETKAAEDSSIWQLMRTSMLDQFESNLKQTAHPAYGGAYTYYQILSPAEQLGRYSEVETLFWLHKGESLFPAGTTPGVKTAQTAFDTFIQEYLTELEKYIEYTRGPGLKEKARKMARYLKDPESAMAGPGGVGDNYAALADHLFGEGLPSSLHNTYNSEYEAIRRRGVLAKVYHSGRGYGSSPINKGIDQRFANNAQWGRDPIYSFYSTILPPAGGLTEPSKAVDGQVATGGPRFGGLTGSTLGEAYPAFFAWKSGEVPDEPEQALPIGGTPIYGETPLYEEALNFMGNIYAASEEQKYGLAPYVSGGQMPNTPMPTRKVPTTPLASTIQDQAYSMPVTSAGAYDDPAAAATTRALHELPQEAVEGIPTDVLSSMPDPFDDEQAALRGKGLPYLMGRWTGGGSYEWENMSEEEKQEKKGLGEWKTGTLFVPTKAFALLLDKVGRQVRGFGDL